MTVYVVQQHQRRNRETGHWEVVHDLTPARAFGDVEVLLGPTAVPYGDPTDIIDELHEKLQHYNPARDYVLPMGNPALIGWAVAIAADYGDGVVHVLVWSARDGKYVSTTALLFPDCGEDAPVG